MGYPSAMRYTLALALGCLLAGHASANPVSLVLANSEAAPDVADPAASNLHEAIGEPAAEGELDAADLSSLNGRLSSIVLAYETFRDSSSIDADAKTLIGYTAPQGLIPNPADRVQTLDRVYRALALLDDTRALRYPEGEACARAHRLALLRSSDGLFVDPKTGELAPWLKFELKRSKANDLPGGLIAASAREWTVLGYLKSLSEVRALSVRLSDKNVLGAARADAFCRRAKLYEELAGAQSALRWNDPDLTAQAKAVVEVRLGKNTGTGTIIMLDGKPTAIVSSRFTENAYEPPDLYAKSGKRLSGSYLRRGPTLSLLSIQSSPDVEALNLPDASEQGERVAYAVGHPIQGGSWSVTRGLARPDGAMIRTDAAVDGAQSGGPLFDARGRLAGIVAQEGAAFDLAAIKNWLADENGKLPEVVGASEFGTGALLTASSVEIPGQKGVLIESGAVCRDQRGCELPRPVAPPPSGGGIDHSAPYTGPNLWSMLGKLLKPAPKKEYVIPDNRPSHAPAAVRPVAPEPPKPPPDPLKPASIKLSVSRAVLAQGEELEAVATIAFTGKDGSKAGRSVAFTVVPGGKINCPGAKTDASGVARTTCTAMEDGRDSRFDELQDETRRRLGMKTPGRVRRKVVKGDKIGALKDFQDKAIGSLDAEDEMHPELGNSGSDTPGIDKPIPETEVTELEIKGDRVTLGASLEKLIDSIKVDVLERPCPGEGIPEFRPARVNWYSCGAKVIEKPADKNFDAQSGPPTSGPNEGESSSDSGANGAPNEAPGQTTPNGTTPEGRPYTRHYSEDTGPIRNIPGSVVDHIIETVPPQQSPDGKNVRYDAENDVTVVTGRNGIISVHRGKPRKDQMK